MQEAISELEEIKHRAARSQQESARRDQISARHREVVETLRAEQVRLAAELASGAAREEALKEVARSNELRLQREISVLRQEVSRSAEREAAAGREAALATRDEGEVRLRARCEALLARQAELQGAAERERSEAASALERERAAREQSCADVTVGCRSCAERGSRLQRLQRVLDNSSDASKYAAMAAQLKEQQARYNLEAAQAERDREAEQARNAQLRFMQLSTQLGSFSSHPTLIPKLPPFTLDTTLLARAATDELRGELEASKLAVTQAMEAAQLNRERREEWHRERSELIRSLAAEVKRRDQGGVPGTGLAAAEDASLVDGILRSLGKLE
ncbi:MAG: hypothetical protein SGPRY_000128 [Prymnesium sp.]